MLQVTTMSESVIDVSELSRCFGPKTALDSVSVSMPRGAVYGLVGANGAGKTTLIKHILGLLRAESGSVRVFGLDPVTDPVAVLSRIGYLSEENDLPGWMRVDELIRYSRAFYPAWDDAYAEELRSTFALDPAHTEVAAIARHLVVSKVRGTFADTTGTIVIAADPLQSSVTASIPSPIRSPCCRASDISPRKTTSPAGCASTSSFATRAHSIQPGTMLTPRSCGRRSHWTPRPKSRICPRGRKRGRDS